MEASIYEIEEHNIKIYVPTLYIKELIQQESPLHEEVRDTFHLPTIIFTVEVSREKFPDYQEINKQKLKLTPRELYETMQNKNEQLKDLVRLFELRLDE